MSRSAPPRAVTLSSTHNEKGAFHLGRKEKLDELEEKELHNDLEEKCILLFI